MRISQAILSYWSSQSKLNQSKWQSWNDTEGWYHTESLQMKCGSRHSISGLQCILYLLFNLYVNALFLNYFISNNFSLSNLNCFCNILIDLVKVFDKVIEIFFLDKELYRKYLLILFTMENWINGLTLDISIG